MVQLRIVLAEDAGLCDDACPKADEDARPAGRSESEDLHRRKGPETMDFKRFQLFLLQIVRGAYSYFNLLRSSHLN